MIPMKTQTDEIRNMTPDETIPKEKEREILNEC